MPSIEWLIRGVRCDRVEQGLADVTGSEEVGAHYDKVVSLSGAGMPQGWRADPSTTYTNYSYYDILQEVQQTGQIWDGDVPRSDPAFTHGPFGIPIGVNQITLMDNHNLVATNSRANQHVLNDVIREVYQ